MTEKPTQKTADMQKMGRIFTIALLVIAVILAILEVFLHRHGVAAIEDSFMFPAIFGFFAFVFIVQVGKTHATAAQANNRYSAKMTNTKPPAQHIIARRQPQPSAEISTSCHLPAECQ